MTRAGSIIVGVNVREGWKGDPLEVVVFRPLIDGGHLLSCGNPQQWVESGCSYDTASEKWRAFQVDDLRNLILLASVAAFRLARHPLESLEYACAPFG